MNTHLLRAQEVAAVLNVSRSQAFALMRNGDLATVRFGRSVRVRPEDLEEFIEKNLNAGMKNVIVVSATNNPKQVSLTSRES